MPGDLVTRYAVFIKRPGQATGDLLCFGRAPAEALNQPKAAPLCGEARSMSSSGAPRSLLC